jgi:hypothetical protein
LLGYKQEKINFSGGFKEAVAVKIASERVVAI